MKKLSIEEKATRYDEAIEKLREEQVMIDIEKFICSLLADHPVGVTVREDIHKALKDQGLEYKGGKIVPIEDKATLKESEDEKVRESIIELVKQSSEILDKKNQERMLAWLKKQYEHQKFRDSIQVGDKVTRNKDGILVNLSQLNRVAKKDNKQGEQIDLANKEYWRGYREGKQEILDKYSELEKQGKKGTNGNNREIPNSAWSEEDEVGLGEAMWTIKQAKTIAKDENDMGNLWYAERWLKSLKERYTWKPSDEQMDALLVKIPIENSCNKVNNILKSLYSDLKRLK